MPSDTAVFNGFMADAIVSKLLLNPRPKCIGERIPCTPEECRRIALESINQEAIVRHAERLLGRSLAQKASTATADAGGRVSFAMTAKDSSSSDASPSLIVAHAQLVCRCNKDDDDDDNETAFAVDEDKAYPMGSEVATMECVRQACPDLPLLRVFAYEGPGSPLAEQAGALYMLVEAAPGRSLQEVAAHFEQLPTSIQEHIIGQWARVQVRLASLAFDQIGAISVVADQSGPVMGQLPRLLAMGCHGPDAAGPFSTAFDYFMAVANAALAGPAPPAGTLDGTAEDGLLLARRRLGAAILREIVARTTLFGAPDRRQMFPLSMMELRPEHVFVDDDFHVVAMTGWGSAQTAPWQAHHCPELFASSSQEAVYRQSLVQQEADMKKTTTTGQGVLSGSLADTLDSPAARIYACFTRLGRSLEADDGYVREMVRLGMGWEGQLADLYIKDMEKRYC